MAYKNKKAQLGKAQGGGLWGAAKSGANKLKSFFGFKHGGPVKAKNGGNVPGMYKHGGMHDGMDSPQPKGIYHKSFKKK